MSKSKPVKAWRGWLLIAGLGLGSFFTLAIWRWCSDEPPPADDDMRPARGEVRAKQNGLRHLIEFAAKVRSLPPSSEDLQLQQVLRGTVWNVELARQLIAKHAGVLEAMDRAIGERFFQVPEAGSLYTEVPYLLDLRMATQLASLHFKVALENRQMRAALDVALRLVQLGKRLEDAQGILIDFGEGQSIKAVGLKHVRELLRAPDLDPQILRTALRIITRCRADRESFADVLRREYMLFAGAIDATAAGGADSLVPELLNEDIGSFVGRAYASNYMLKPNVTKRLLATGWRLCVNNIYKPYAAMDHRLPYPRGRRFPFENSTGDYVLSINSRIWRETLMLFCQTEAAFEATRALIALRLSRIATGELPESLEKLVPTLLESLPRDSFDGAPLRYSAETRVVYSVGKDLKDESGSGDEDDANEPSFQIAF